MCFHFCFGKNLNGLIKIKKIIEGIFTSIEYRTLRASTRIGIACLVAATCGPSNRPVFRRNVIPRHSYARPFPSSTSIRSSNLLRESARRGLRGTLEKKNSFNKFSTGKSDYYKSHWYKVDYSRNFYFINSSFQKR